MPVVDLERNLDAGLLGREDIVRERRRRLREACIVDRDVELHRVDGERLIVLGITARKTKRERDAHATDLAIIRIRFGARLGRFAFAQPVDEIGFAIDPHIEAAPSCRQHAQHVVFAGIDAFTAQVLHRARDAVGIPERKRCSICRASRGFDRIRRSEGIHRRACAEGTSAPRTADAKR